MNPHVYLAGGISGLSDYNANFWRDVATGVLKQFNIDAYNPMLRDYRGKEEENVVEIVEKDKQEILHSMAVLCRAETPSWGTGMEIMYSYNYKIPIVAYTGPGFVSPWILYHTTRVVTLAEGIQKIIHICASFNDEVNDVVNSERFSVSDLQVLIDVQKTICKDAYTLAEKTKSHGS